MRSQLKTLRSESKGKNSLKVSTSMDDLKYLMDFNSSITQAAAKTMEHLSEFVFIWMGNLTLARRDTVTALRMNPLHIPTLFPDTWIKRAEEEISHCESKRHSGTSCGKARFHPCERSDRRSDKRLDKKADKPAWKNIGKGQYRKPRGKASSYPSRPAKGQQSYK